MDNEPLDVPGEVAKVACIALDAVLLEVGGERPRMADDFIAQFIGAAGANMARPERPEDVERFAFLAASILKNDPELFDTLTCLIRRALHAYMRPA